MKNKGSQSLHPEGIGLDHDIRSIVYFHTDPVSGGEEVKTGLVAVHNDRETVAASTWLGIYMLVQVPAEHQVHAGLVQDR